MNKFLIIVIALLIMWGGIMAFFYLKADEVTKDPCAICAERMGKNILCTTQTQIPSTRTYYTNGTIVTDTPEIKDIPENIGWNKVYQGPQKPGYKFNEQGGSVPIS